MLSLVTTVYNDAKHIDKFMSNILGQTVLPDEFIIVDGGSKDNTVAILDGYREKYPFIRVLSGERLNISGGFNKGIENASFQLIALCLVGVSYESNWLEELIEPLKRSDTYQISCSYYNIDAGTYFAELYKKKIRTKVPDKTTFMPSTRSIAFRKTVWMNLGGYFTGLTYAGEDTIFALQCRSRNYEIYVVEEYLCTWSLPKSLKSILKHKMFYSIADVELGMRGNYYFKRMMFIGINAFFVMGTAINLNLIIMPFLLFTLYGLREAKLCNMKLNFKSVLFNNLLFLYEVKGYYFSKKKVVLNVKRLASIEPVTG